MSMRPVYVKFEERHHRILQQRARDEGCSMSDLIRRATIGLFHLPTRSEEFASAGEQSATRSGGLSVRNAHGETDAAGDSDLTRSEEPATAG